MEKNYASLQERVGDPVETCNAQHVSMEEKLNELSVMYDDLEQYTTKFNLYIYMGDVNTYSALCGWKFYLCNARNACSYAIPEGLVTRDPPPISCSLRYPAKTERRHNSRGATISLGALFKLSSLFTKWGEMRVFLRCRSV